MKGSVVESFLREFERRGRFNISYNAFYQKMGCGTMKRENNGGGRAENFDLSDSKTRRVEILTLNELKSDYPQIFHRSFSVNDLKSIRFCKADILGDYIIGTFALPKREYLSDEEYAFGYFATD